MAAADADAGCIGVDADAGWRRFAASDVRPTSLTAP
jgi:hypothetical protein